MSGAEVASLMGYHIPEEEKLAQADLAALQRCKLAGLLSRVQESNPFYRNKYARIAFDAMTDPLDRLPLTTREEVQRDQRDHPPYGTNLTEPMERYTRLHQTSGSTGHPVRWLDTPEGWNWFGRCWGIIYRAADVSSNDRIVFPFSFGPFIGFWAAFDAATELGAMCLPAGGMTTTSRLRYITDNAVTLVCCTPTYALRMAEVADQEGVDLAGSAVRALIVAGEPGGSIPAVRNRIETAWGAQVLDHAGMTEVGPWGFQVADDPDGMYIIESEFIAEVLAPGTDQPVPEGELGELVLTNLGRTASPLIRYRTGDQVRLTRHRRAGERWFARLEGGVLGRIDDMLVIRGNNVFPSAVEGIVRGFDEVAEFRLHVEERHSMVDLRLEIEPAPQADAARLAENIGLALRNRLHFRPTVTLAKPGALPRFEMKAKRLIRNVRA